MKKKRKARVERVPYHIRQAVDRLTDDPVVRAVMYTTVAALEDPEIGDAFARSSPGSRGGILTAVMRAARDLMAGRACDTCPARATRVRPLVVGPDECSGIVRGDGSHSMVGFTLACDACAALPAAEHRAKAVETLAGIQAGPDFDPHNHGRPVVEGRRVGDAAGLPPRASLRTCERCEQTIWCDQDFQDWVADPKEPVAFMCRECVEDAAAEGVAIPIPTGLIA